MRAFSCPFHVTPQVVRHPCSVTPRRLALLSVFAFTAAVLGWAMPRVIRAPEPTAVSPIILRLEERGSEVSSDRAEGKTQTTRGGGTVNGEGSGSGGARAAQPPPPPPAGDDDGAGDDGDD